MVIDMKYIYFLLILLCSCKSVGIATAVVQSDSSKYTEKNATVDTIYVRDSIFIREMQKGDTIFRDRIEWRDRWRTRIVRDTVVDVRVEKEVVELPPERYIPKFYKWCTIILWALVAGAIIAAIGVVWRVR